MTPDEGRRRSDRIAFRVPRPAKFATRQVVLVDLSTRGAGIRHHEKIDLQTHGTLRFQLERSSHTIECLLTRSTLEMVNVGTRSLQIYRSGLKFVGIEDAAASVKEAIRKRVARALLRQRADALGDASLEEGIDDSSGSIPIDLLATYIDRSLYIRCTLERGGRWKQEKVNDASQPLNGFTLPADEAPGDVALLTKTYEVATEEQRRLIRLFASIATSEPSDVPKRRYVP
jgi:hypothetical protein